MEPEYALRGQLTEKADVFSGQNCQNLVEDSEFVIERTWRLYEAERALEIMESTLEGTYSWEEVFRVTKIGLLCTQAAPVLRPSMSQVVLMLTNKRENHPSPTAPALVDLDGVATPDQVEGGRFIDSAAASSTKPSEFHSAAADPSSSAVEPR
eukprot:PITA_31453